MTKEKQVSKTTKKTAPKKPETKSVRKVMPLNRQNAEAFADLIFSDVGGQVSFLKLCDAVLANGKDGGRTMHCAIGEAYYHFVGDDILKFMKSDVKFCGVGTNLAIEAIANKASLKNSKPITKTRLIDALGACLSKNDEEKGTTDSEAFFARSESVAYIWRTKVIPLLK